MPPAESPVCRDRFPSQAPPPRRNSPPRGTAAAATAPTACRVRGRPVPTPSQTYYCVLIWNPIGSSADAREGGSRGHVPRGILAPRGAEGPSRRGRGRREGTRSPAVSAGRNAGPARGGGRPAQVRDQPGAARRAFLIARHAATTAAFRAAIGAHPGDVMHRASASGSASTRTSAPGKAARSASSQRVVAAPGEVGRRRGQPVMEAPAGKWRSLGHPSPAFSVE